MRDPENDVEALERWWARTRDDLDRRGVRLVRGEVTGRNVSLVSIELDSAFEATEAMIDAIKPILCAWWPEVDGNGVTVEYHLGLLVGHTWHVLCCGTPVSEEQLSVDLPDDDDGEDVEGMAVDESVMVRLRALIDDVVLQLASSVEVNEPHNRRTLRDVLQRHLEKTMSSQSEDLRRAYERERWGLPDRVADQLTAEVKRSHVQQLRRDSDPHAVRILEAEPDLKRETRASRVDAAYHYMKVIDPVCVTRSSVGPVVMALEELIARRDHGETLFSPSQ